jgi:hypothetical protein
LASHLASKSFEVNIRTSSPSTLGISSKVPHLSALSFIFFDIFFCVRLVQRRNSYFLLLGTVFSALNPTFAFEPFAMMGYDVVGLGPRDFDLFSSENSSAILRAMYESTGGVFSVVATGFDARSDADLESFVKPYAILNVSGFLVGVLAVTNKAGTEFDSVGRPGTHTHSQFSISS